jgi:hypothetical protein
VSGSRICPLRSHRATVWRWAFTCRANSHMESVEPGGNSVTRRAREVALCSSRHRDSVLTPIENVAAMSARLRSGYLSW